MNCAQLDAPISAAHSGSGSPSSRSRQRALPERPVDDHGHAALGRQRQQPLLRLAVDDVVGELHEIDRLAPHDLLEKIVTAAFGGGDADVTQRARRLHLEQRLQMRLPGERDCEPGRGRTAARPRSGAIARSAPDLPLPTTSRPCRPRTARRVARASEGHSRSPAATSHTWGRNRSCGRRPRRRRP